MRCDGLRDALPAFAAGRVRCADVGMPRPIFPPDAGSVSLSLEDRSFERFPADRIVQSESALASSPTAIAVAAYYRDARRCRCRWRPGTRRISACGACRGRWPRRFRAPCGGRSGLALRIDPRPIRQAFPRSPEPIGGVRLCAAGRLCGSVATGGLGRGLRGLAGRRGLWSAGRRSVRDAHRRCRDFGRKLVCGARRGGCGGCRDLRRPVLTACRGVGCRLGLLVHRGFRYRTDSGRDRRVVCRGCVRGRRR